MSSLLDTGSRAVRAGVFVAPLGVWVLMAVVAVLNGGFREVVLIPRVGEYGGHILSTLLLVIAILGLSGLYFSWSAVAYSRFELLLVGTLWTLLTVGFEFLVGAVEGTPVSVTLGQYNILAGQVWIAVPITLFVSPLLFGWYVGG